MPLPGTPTFLLPTRTQSEEGDSGYPVGVMATPQCAQQVEVVPVQDVDVTVLSVQGNNCVSLLGARERL